ncbi:MAG: hypothetical protein U1C70_06245 [Sediminibacterium sp.]|jgi:hypothetical protein|uniref:hypothetical protein n=1 Tax=Sediminibacterium sp. TaxID=1917865 RepID=UPI002AB9F3BA|nr:hypothetical protein [Sediminibacterium sp.]MDZ4071404.1 hypothetical protein [Sediminibacterium sp.]
MKQHKPFILTLFVFTAIEASSQNVWTELKTPSSSIIGQLVLKNGLNNQGVTNEKITTYEGVSQLTKADFRQWTIHLTSALSTSKTKFISATYKNIKIDALKDKEIFNDSKYYENFFIYRAKKADSVTFTFVKQFDASLSPSEKLSDSLEIITKLKAKFPNLDSLQITYNLKDTIKYLIANPNVYFEAEAIQFQAKKSFILLKNKFEQRVFIDYPEDNQEEDLLKAATNYSKGEKKTINIPFKGGISIELFTSDIEVNNFNRIDTTFRLSIDVSKTYRNECYYHPMPYIFDFDQSSIRTKIYTANENILLTTSDNNQFLVVYLTINATQKKDGVALQRRLSNGFLANRIDYLTLNFKRYNRQTIQ